MCVRGVVSAQQIYSEEINNSRRRRRCMIYVQGLFVI